MQKDIRWIQRFRNYKKALGELRKAFKLSETRKLSSLEEQGVIQSFEYTFELAWNVLKDYLNHKGFQGIIGSKDTIRLAFKNELIAEGEVWMDMIVKRNLTAHTYDTEIASEVFQSIIEIYFDEFEKLENTFDDFEKDE